MFIQAERDQIDEGTEILFSCNLECCKKKKCCKKYKTKGYACKKCPKMES
jgi:hypothetical protein